MEPEVSNRNRAAVLAHVLEASPTTRAAAATATGLSPATVSRMVDALMSEGLLRETDEVASGRRGRRATLLEAVADRSVVVGVDLGASSARFIVADLLGQPLHHRTCPTPTDRGPAELAAWLAEEVVATAGDLADRLAAVAIGLPGAVRRHDRRVFSAPNLPQVEQPVFLDVLEERLGPGLDLDNDSNYALLGEQRFGAARSAPTAVMLTVGAGLGAGVALDGRLLRGRNGLVGEFGHLPVGPLGSPLEHLVTGPGIMRRAAELGVDIASPAALFSPDADGQLLAMRRHVEQALLVVLTAAVVSYEPDTIVLGGRIARSLAPHLDGLGEDLRRTVPSAPPVVPAQLGDLSGALGAVVAALHRVYLGLGVGEQDLVRVPRPRDLGLAESDLADAG
ncbi:ROK family protein [Blastococcus sp. PRF04-17]|uniref:ROK family protein n=1 Tax=Blastococcus sp. PRF04-17 TaxID=2933797 RepID=UPI001FF5E448|nr:ROK family protein [Blastococcus sp. PRF04-17]UOY02863.1 ROK family protein [Blastococcus sp. PRF04-17]